MNCGNLGALSGVETFQEKIVWSNISQIFEIKHSTVIRP